MKNRVYLHTAGALCIMVLMVVGCTQVVGPQPYGGGTYGVGTYGVSQGYYTTQPVYANYYPAQPVYTNYGYAPYGYYTGYNPANAIVPGLVGFGLGAAYAHNYNNGWYGYRNYNYNNINYSYVNNQRRWVGPPHYYGGYHGNGPIIAPHHVVVPQNWGGRFHR